MAESTQSIITDGSSGYVDAASAPVAGGDYTVALWAKTSNTSQNGTVCALGNVGTTDSWVRIFATSGGLWNLNLGDSGGSQDHIDSLAGISSGTWTHLAFTKASGGVWSFYVNGVMQGTASNATLNAFTGFVLGVLHYSFDLQFFDGSIDEVAVWNSVLTTGNMTDLAAGTITPGSLSPTLLWKLEEGSGTTTADTSGNGNGGTFHAGVTWSSSVPSQLAGGGGSDTPLNASPGSFALTGSPTLLAVAANLGTGSFAETGSAAKLALGLAAAPGAFAETGTAAALSVGLNSAPATFAEIGSPVLSGIALNGAPGALTLTGFAANLIAGGNVALDALPGAFAVTGVAALLGTGTAVGPGSVALTGAGAAFAVGLGSGPGAFTLTGFAATLVASGASPPLAGRPISVPAADRSAVALPATDRSAVSIPARARD